jgi:hypothetical protein
LEFLEKIRNILKINNIIKDNYIFL